MKIDSRVSFSRVMWSPETFRARGALPDDREARDQQSGCGSCRVSDLITLARVALERKLAARECGVRPCRRR